MFLGPTVQGSFKGEIMNVLEAKYNMSFTQKFNVSDLQISIIRKNSPLDVSPYLKLK